MLYNIIQSWATEEAMTSEIDERHESIGPSTYDARVLRLCHIIRFEIHYVKFSLGFINYKSIWVHDSRCYDA